MLAALIRQEPLGVQQRDHPLRGIWKGYRETHLEPDWLLIYRVEGNELHLVRIGSASARTQTSSRNKTGQHHPFPAQLNVHRLSAHRLVTVGTVPA